MIAKEAAAHSARLAQKLTPPIACHRVGLFLVSILNRTGTSLHECEGSVTKLFLSLSAAKV